MIRPNPQPEISVAPVSSEKLEAVCQRAAREAQVRNARLGFPSVGMENGKITFWSPERVLREFGAEFPLPVFTEDEYPAKKPTAAQQA